MSLESVSKTFALVSDRDRRMQRDLLQVQADLDATHDKMSPLYQEHLAKQKKLQEQQALQNPAQVRSYYHTLEVYLGARLNSSVVLTNKLVQRHNDKVEKVAKSAASAIGGACEAIPVVGGLIGSMVSFGLSTGLSAARDVKHRKDDRNVLESLPHYDDVSALAELVARRVTQAFQPTITSYSTNDAEEEARKCAEFIHNIFKSGELQKVNTIDEKMAIILEKVKQLAAQKKSFLKRGPTLFGGKGVSPAGAQHAAEKAAAVDNRLQQLEVKDQSRTLRRRARQNALSDEVQRLRAEAAEKDARLARLEAEAAERAQKDAQRDQLLERLQQQVLNGQAVNPLI